MAEHSHAGPGPAALPHVVIVGRRFRRDRGRQGPGRRARVRVTLVDRRNHHVFQPLLYQVATAALNPANIASPIRRILRGRSNVEVLLGDVEAVDVAHKDHQADRRRAARYDYLIVATGRDPQLFRPPGMGGRRAGVEVDRGRD